MVEFFNQPPVGLRETRDVRFLLEFHEGPRDPDPVVRLEAGAEVEKVAPCLELLDDVVRPAVDGYGVVVLGEYRGN